MRGTRDFESWWSRLSSSDRGCMQVPVCVCEWTRRFFLSDPPILQSEDFTYVVWLLRPACKKKIILQATYVPESIIVLTERQRHWPKLIMHVATYGTLRFLRNPRFTLDKLLKLEHAEKHYSSHERPTLFRIHSNSSSSSSVGTVGIVCICNTVFVRLRANFFT